MTAECDDTQQPAPTPLLFAGAAALGLAALAGALEGVSHLEAVPWGWLAAAAVAATVGLVWVLGRPEKRPLLFPMAWLWALLAGIAVFDALWPFAPSGGKAVSTSAGEFIVPSSGWESFGLSLLGTGLLFWLIVMLLTGFVLFLYSIWMVALAGVAAVRRRRHRGSEPEVSQ